MKRLRIIAAVLLVSVAALACFHQFRTGHLGPTALAALVLVGAWRLRPSFRWLGLALPVITFFLLGVDAFLLRHRVAIELRTWSLVWDTKDIHGVLASPSGRSTVYIVGSHWLDSSYSAYISDGRLFPRHGYIQTKSADASYSRDLTVRWRGDVFTATEQFLALRYTESTRTLETFTP